MLFNFRLRPLDEVQPWGEPGARRLHWFGLTDGEYWIQAGKDALFEYSKLVRDLRGIPRYCDYQVVRLYEDIVELVPDVLDPVPVDLRSHISMERRADWISIRDVWFGRIEQDLPEDRYWDCVEAATTWIGRRTLDSGYLSPPTRIQFWSDDKDVHIEWDNREGLIGGVQAWASLSGSHKISRGEFVAEVQSFHDRLMEQMAERVSLVKAGALGSDIGIDIPGLEREHQQRSAPITRLFLDPPQPADWAAVRSVVEALRKHGLE